MTGGSVGNANSRKRGLLSSESFIRKAIEVCRQHWLLMLVLHFTLVTYHNYMASPYL